VLAVSRLGDGLLPLMGAVTSLLAGAVAALAVFVLYKHRANVLAAERSAERRMRWEPFVLDVLIGESPEAASVIRRGEERVFVHFLLGYSRRLSGVDRKVVLRLAEPHLWSVLGDLIDTRPEVRARAIETLSELGFEDHVIEIIRALDDPSPVVASVAAHAMTRPGHPELGAEVVARLDRFTSWDQGFLAAMLASAGPGVSSVLRVTLLDSSRSPRVRTVCADALRLLCDPDAADPAAAVLDKATDQELTAACLRLLRQVGRSEHAPAVRRWAREGGFATRAHALSTLGTIGDASDASLARLALFDPSPWVALHAARALMSLGEDGAVRSLARMDHPRRDLAFEMLEGQRV